MDVRLTDDSGTTEIGRCIYCDPSVVNDDLSNEHVAPEGLMGKWELIRASCAKHRDLTSAIEGKALRGPFGPARFHYKMYTRRWRKHYRRDNPGGNPDDPTLRERFRLDGDSTEEVDIPVSRHPYSLLMPSFKAVPEILTGGTRWPPDRKWQHEYAVHVNRDTRSRFRALMAENPKRVYMLQRFDDENLMKMIAKICYCFALFLGVEPFRPQILEYILSAPGDNTWGRYFIGAPIEDHEIRLPDKLMNSVHMRQVLDAKTDSRYAVARIRLGNNQMPIYDVVLGTLL